MTIEFPPSDGKPSHVIIAESVARRIAAHEYRLPVRVHASTRPQSTVRSQRPHVLTYVGACMLGALLGYILMGGAS